MKDYYLKSNKGKDIYCGNCGKYGHTYKKCDEPITSLGVICYKIEKKTIKYLLIQRKDSLGYVEFIRGRYKTNDILYLEKIFKEMTNTEIKKILDNQFEYLWENLWMSPNSKQYKLEYESALYKFNLIKNGYNNEEGILINLEYIINRIDKFWNITEWGFPKGRRNLKESDINCADREFQEETGFSKSDYIIIKNIKPVEEVFKGSNNTFYKHIYYIGKIITNKKAEIQYNNLTQAAEVGDIGWFSFLEAMDILRPYNIAKKMVLEKVNSIIFENNLNVDNYLIYSSPTMKNITNDSDIDNDLVII